MGHHRDGFREPIPRRRVSPAGSILFPSICPEWPPSVATIRGNGMRCVVRPGRVGRPSFSSSRPLRIVRRSRRDTCILELVRAALRITDEGGVVPMRCEGRVLVKVGPGSFSELVALGISELEWLGPQAPLRYNARAQCRSKVGLRIQDAEIGEHRSACE